MKYDLCRYFNENGDRFWSEALDFDKRVYHGPYEQKIIKCAPVLDPAAFAVNMFQHNYALNEDVPYY